MKKLLFLSIMFLFTQPALAQFRSLGTGSDIIKLGRPDVCSYRLVFRENNPGKGQIRVPLPQSAYQRTASASLPNTNNYRGHIDRDTLDEIIDMQFLTADQVSDVLNESQGGGDFFSASVTLLERGSRAAVELAVTINGGTETSTVQLSPGSVGVEEYCSSRRFAAKLVRKTRR